ncbi:hypothetical protein [Lysobacter auxotrophicus]|uniref:Sulfotransferase n=1 Tax=Lysobacter auxotrophicus TaxID=2992573 RepID=A0ABM8DAB0_9GAMM|nr:hypothetical protein [Lysobacter auxotrophicus]BDU15464.1 sulfotransferase [Lysobacter auxotrophicus]
MSPPRRLPPDFSRSAAYPLFAIDPAQNRAWVLHFEADDYRRASFLDQRALGRREVSGWTLDRSELEAALAPSPPLREVHWLFHIGHCGSSLVSRLLDLVPGVLGLREPLPLLALAHGRDDPSAASWETPVLALLARGFPDSRAVIVKPTSVVTTLADRLLPTTGRACLLWVDLQTWLATMLRDARLIEGALSTEPLRLARQPALPPADSEAARLARAWLIEQLRWRALAADPTLSERLIDLDFADVLRDPAPATARLAAHYGLDVPDDWAQRIKSSELLSRYAKDGDAHFDANARRRELAAAAEKHADGIVEGLQWAQEAIESAGVADLAPRLRPRA